MECRVMLTENMNSCSLSEIVASPAVLAQNPHRCDRFGRGGRIDVFREGGATADTRSIKKTLIATPCSQEISFTGPCSKYSQRQQFLAQIPRRCDRFEGGGRIDVFREGSATADTRSIKKTWSAASCSQEISISGPCSK